jgi:hypothetical protein
LSSPFEHLKPAYFANPNQRFVTDQYIRGGRQELNLVISRTKHNMGINHKHSRTWDKEIDQAATG